MCVCVCVCVCWGGGGGVKVRLKTALFQWMRVTLFSNEKELERFVRKVPLGDPPCRRSGPVS